MSPKLFVAASEGDVAKVKKLLQAGAKVDEKNEDGHTPLMEAASQGHDEIVKLLLDSGSNPKLHNSLALDFAVRMGNSQTVQLLLEAGADVHRAESKSQRQKKGQDHIEDPPPIFDALIRGDKKIVEVLLAAGANVKILFNRYGLISAAAKHKDPSLFQLMIDNGAKPNGALRIAIENGHSNYVDSLLTLGCNLEEIGTDGMTPLALAAYYGEDSIVQKLLEAGADKEKRDEMGRSPLAHAVSEGKPTAAKLLIDAGAQLLGDQRDSLLSMAIMMEHAKVVRLLLESGVDPNEHPKAGLPPLFAAVEQGKEAIVSLLLESGADPNFRVESKPKSPDFRSLSLGTTPLMIAAKKGKAKIVQLLLAAGADPALVDEKNRTAADFAAKAGRAQVLELFKQAGSDTSMDRVSQNNAALITALRERKTDDALAAIDAGIDPNCANKEQKSALTFAAQNGMTEVIKKLLKAGADPNRQTEWGESPLRHAVLRTNVEVVKLLIDAGANVNARYEPGSIPADQKNTVFFSSCSPLHDAAAWSTPAVVDLLIAAGADINVVGADDSTPILNAANYRRMDNIEQLLKAGALVRPQDDIWLSPYYFAKAAKAAKFVKFTKELSKLCGAPPEPIESLPGALAFRLTLDQPPMPMPSLNDVESARKWGKEFASNHAELDQKADSFLNTSAARARELGYLLIDAGKPIGCGPMVQFLALLPTADKYHAMAAMGIRGNDQQLTASEIIDWFRKLEQEEPFELLGLKFDTVEIEFHRLVADPNGLAIRMSKFCHDLAGGGKEGIKKIAQSLRENRRIRFWWD